MFCNKCGVTLPDNAPLCTNCGAATASSPAFGAPISPGSPQQTEGKAVGSLISGILAFILIPFVVGIAALLAGIAASLTVIAALLAGIAAIVLGHMALSSIKKSAGRLKGEGMATTGLVLGYLNVASLPFLLIIAAIAIPNLMRARQAANSAEAASVVRTVNTTQITYSTIYEKNGYARDLASLGPGAGFKCPASGPNAAHACLLDGVLGNSTCTGSRWCSKDAYRYNLQATCGADGACTEYVFVATPSKAAAGERSFCSTSDAIVRMKPGLVQTAPSAEECHGWEAL
jgi:type II secretory pathway pseudopilin PulG